MPDIALRLVAEERRGGNSSDTAGRAAFRVCEKLRRPLTILVGTAGYQSLISRAVTLARVKAPSLGRLQINPDGSLEIPPAIEVQFETNDPASGGAVLVAQLIELLITFIGEALTLRLVHDIWPKVALRNQNSKTG